MCECPGCYYASEGFAYNIKESCLSCGAGQELLHSHTSDSSLEGEDEDSVWHEVVLSLASSLGGDIEEDSQGDMIVPAGTMEGSDRMGN